MTTIVFSKDRAMQLDAFLRSYERHVGHGRVDVIWTASSLRHEDAYRSLPIRQWVWMNDQSDSFKDDVLFWLHQQHDGNVVFFVDDQIFVRPWTVLERPGLSLRLGPNLTRNYASADAPQPLPPFEMTASTGLLSWRWADGELAWRYPLSLDGHVFDLAEMRSLIASVEFSSPNTLESALQRFVPRFLNRRGFCYCLSKVVNVPWNRVQTDWDNRCGTGHDADALLTQWEAGFRINLSSLDGLVNQSVHQECPFVLEARPADVSA